MAQILFPWMYVGDPQSGRPVALGQMFFGIKDLDPEVPLNQIQLSVKQEDGTLLPVAQPILLNAGGIPTYNGSPVILDIQEEEFSHKVLNSLGAQVYYNENNIPFAWGTNQIEDGAITTIKIEDSAVTTPKIADDAIDKDKIFSDVAGLALGQNIDGSLEVNVDDFSIEIDTDAIRLKDGGVTLAKMASNSVDKANIVADAVGQSEILSGAVHTSELDTSEETQIYNISGAQPLDTDIMSGGDYSFYPRTEITSHDNGFSVEFLIAAGLEVVTGNALRCTMQSPNIGFLEFATGETTNRFVNSSAPWNMGHGDIALFIFLRLDIDGKVDGVTVSPVPTWGYNGKTSVVPDRTSKILNENGDQIGTRKYKNIVNPDSEIIVPPWRGGDPAAWDLDRFLNPELVEVEIGHDLKNKDMIDLPHPFLTLKDGDRVVLIDPTSSIVDSLAALNDRGEKVGRLFMDGHIVVGAEVGVTAPNGVEVRSANWN